MNMEKLRSIIDSTDTRKGKLFALFIQSLIILSLITFSIETLPDLPETTRGLLSNTEVIIVLIFTVEYILRIVAAERKLSFIFSFYGLIDLAAIAPFYLATGLDLRSVRVFRLFRLVRVLKLFRYSAAIRRFKVALVLAREELILFSVAALMLLFLSAVGIYYCENEAQPEVFRSIFDALWWSVATLTTVGYGDIYPVTVAGKLFSFFVLMIGLGIIAVPTGLVASALSEARKLEAEKKIEGDDQDE